MPYPNFRNKHAGDPLITPEKVLSYYAGTHRIPSDHRPHSLILAYHATLVDFVRRRYRTRRVKGFFGEMLLLADTRHRVAFIGNFGVDAPQAVIHLEEFIAWGVRRFVSVGTAGSLQKNLRAGDLVLCERAIRDEGASHHYLLP